MTRLPSLGPRGEGWTTGQTVVLGSLLLSLRGRPAWTGPARTATTLIGGVLVVAGVAVAVAGGLGLGRSLTPFPRPAEDARLVEDGIFGVVRHPVYAGVIAAAAGLALLAAAPRALALAVVTAFYFTLKSMREEAWLAERFAGYEAYRRRTRRLIPGVW